MSSTMRYALISVVVTVVAIGCTSGESSEGATKLSAQDLFAQKDAQNGKKAVVTGSVKSVADRPDGYEIDLDAGPDRSIKVVFADKGAAAKAKGLGQGAAITVQCDVLGYGHAVGEFVMTGNCVLQ
ncbi:MAG: hypothetical protein AB7O24_19260 [Kofleriaceae bacterium]